MAEIVHPFGRKARALAQVVPISCTGCGLCAMYCLMECILQQPDGIYWVDADKCIGCRACKVNCPSEAIVLLPPRQEENP